MENGDRWNERRWNWYSVPEGAGVLAITHTETGRSYFIAVADTRQRAYDHRRLLNLGKHHNLELQRDWTTDPSKFMFVVVEQVAYTPLLAAFKQVAMEREPSCYNVKNSLPRPK